MQLIKGKPNADHFNFICLDKLSPNDTSRDGEYVHSSKFYIPS